VAVRLPIVLAILGALIVAAGTAAVYVPAGIILAGLEFLGAAYLIAYLEARRP
jgi:hypothetical protein